MAIDPKLVSIKKAGDLPSGIPTATGEFLYFEDETLMKAEMSDLYDRLESAYLGIITPSTTIPTTGSWYGTVLSEGVFNNVSPAITVDAADFDVENGMANNEVRIIISEGVASKDVRRVKGETGAAGSVPIVQSTGSSTTDVMSQKTTTDELNNIDRNLSDLNRSVSSEENDDAKYIVRDNFSRDIFKVLKNGDISTELFGSLFEFIESKSTVDFFTYEESDLFVFEIKDPFGRTAAGLKPDSTWVTLEDSNPLPLSIIPPKNIYTLYNTDTLPYARNYAVTVLPESITPAFPSSQVFLNGDIRMQLENFNTTQSDVKVSNTNVKVTAKGYIPTQFDVNLISTKNSVAKNKKIAVLVVGDSITQQREYYHGITTAERYRGGWGFPSIAVELAAMDNKDIGDVKLQTIGTGNNFDQILTHRGENITIRSFNEGRGGWSAYTYAHSPVLARVNWNTYTRGFSAKNLYYLLGMATKTPFDSNIATQTFTNYAQSNATSKAMSSVPVGRYKPDLGTNSAEYAEIASLFNKMKDFSQFTGTGTYTGTEPQKQAILDLWNDLIDNPENPFYSKEKAQAYTGSYVWTYLTAFDFETYLERYRTMDDMGVRLSGSAGQTVVGSDSQSYIIGTKVANVNDWDVFKPTHFINALGTNDFSPTYDEVMVNLSEINSNVKSVVPNCIIGSGTFRSSTVAFPENWRDYGFFAKGAGEERHTLNSMLQTAKGDLTNQDSNKDYFLPFFYVVVPGGTEYMQYTDFVGNQKKNLAGLDSLHIDIDSLYSVGYQMYSWILYTLTK